MCLTQGKDKATSVKKKGGKTTTTKKQHKGQLKNDGGWTKPKENTGKGTLAKKSKKVYKKKKRLTSI